MNAVLERVQEFFAAILGIIESFFGFIRGLFPTKEPDSIKA